MASIRGKNTKPEMLIRKGLFAKGFRYRLHPRGLPGKPDLFLPRFSAAVFIHGCFWHGHSCKLFRMPESNSSFWMEKIRRNREKDLEVRSELLGRSIRVLVVWECSIRGAGQLGLEKTLDKAASWLSSGSSFREIGGKQ